MLDTNVNVVAVLIAVVINMVLGFLWYSPMLMGKPWMKAMGMTQNPPKPSPTIYIWPMLGAAVLSFVLGMVVNTIGANTGYEGAVAGFWMWLGFVVPTMGMNYLFENRPRNLYLVDVGYHLVSLLIVGAVLAVWG